MATQWFRRPDERLVAATRPALAEKYAARGWAPVDTDEAVAEIRSGKQDELNSRLAAQARAADTKALREAAERRRRARIEQVRAEADEAGLAVNPPKPPIADSDAATVVSEEAGPETREH